ncbi:glutathione S-transferase T3-like [Bidens hawaiensis]|uniref:glutathione S-transferase T3-like n=1 Tax=Bidens hawaiensis TaxID=980011 RepID=UPI00404A4650
MTEAARSIQKWSVQEELALARAWVDVSEHPIVGNEQTIYDLWDRVEVKFFEAMGKGPDYRRRDQITGKWTHINKKVNKYIGVYEERARNAKSGTNDVDLHRKVAAHYQDDGHTGNIPLELWEILTASPKWQQLRLDERASGSNKRSSTDADIDASPGASDGRFRTHVNLYDLADEDHIQRPIGRKKAKSIASGSASGSASGAEEVGKLMVEHMRLFNLREDERERRRIEKEEMEIMAVDLDTLTGFKRRWYEKKQKEIAEKNEWV